MVDENASNVPPPYPLAMVICEVIWQDPATAKRFLLGCFSSIAATRFPFTHPTIGIHVALTNGRGTVQFELRLVDANEEREPIWEVAGEVDFDNPHFVAELDFMIADVTFPLPGDYRFQLFASGEFLVERRLSIIERGRPS